ncbi:MAG: hypothetical protein AAB409_06535, partial [Gemmatimonadota bacterium]
MRTGWVCGIALMGVAAGLPGSGLLAQVAAPAGALRSGAEAAAQAVAERAAPPRLTVGIGS